MENYNDILAHLLAHSENEVVEFKAAKNNFDVDDLGKYFSALSNEANLRERDFGWMVFGIDNTTHLITGTSFKNGEQALNKLKQDMSQHMTDNLIFREIVPIFVDGKRILLFKIPASPRNIVIHWKGIAYGRDGESLKPLNQAKRDEIRRQTPIPDWSAQLVPTATISDLDELALATARVMYKKVHSSNISGDEVDKWGMEEFLSNSNMMRDGQLTRAAILLLGKPISIDKIHPTVAQITWTLEDEESIVEDYEHFSIPFLLTVDKVLAKIRNKTMRELPGGTLFPDTMKQYDEYTIREALHNAIAHQDYTLQQRIVFVERPGQLYYGNTFIPGTIEKAIEHNGPQLHYRNECLCKGMVHFNMIDTVGRGIKKIFTEQRNRFFPMPDYDIDNENRLIGVTIYGKMLDEKYSTLLKNNNNLTLKECIWLDAVQKKRLLAKQALDHLKARKLVEGRGKSLTISLGVARLTHQVGQYTKNKGLAYEALKKLILQLAYNAGKDGFKLSEAFEGVEHALPYSKTPKAKKDYLGRILAKMALADLIFPDKRTWYITSKGESGIST
ncbi:MAG: putative DNA binding domain-containing protein [Bacteroidales bacterium]|nr:putative DNA binding domain-containing protein [Bacteroidales bacterium]